MHIWYGKPKLSSSAQSLTHDNTFNRWFWTNSIHHLQRLQEQMDFALTFSKHEFVSEFVILVTFKEMNVLKFLWIKEKYMT